MINEKEQTECDYTYSEDRLSTDERNSRERALDMVEQSVTIKDGMPNREYSEDDAKDAMS